jgi:hypothetical protein
LKLFLGFVLLFASQKQFYANPLVSTSTTVFYESKHLNNEVEIAESLKPWMRWGGLAFLGMGTLLYVNTNEQLPQTLGVAGAGLGFAGFVWSFRF